MALFRKLNLIGNLAVLAAGVQLLSVPLVGQTLTVSKTSPADHTTIQDAIDALAPGGGSDDSDTSNNVIQILDDSVYQEAILVDGFGITIESTGLNRPRLIANATEAATNPSNFHMRFDSDDLCALRRLIIMPATESQPQGCITFDEFSGNPGLAYDVILEDVLIAANNGADQPISTDGKTTPDGSEIRYGDDVLDFNSTPNGATPAVTLTRTIVTSASSGSGDLVRLFVDNAAISINEGCVFSFSADHGLFFSTSENSIAEWSGTSAEPIIIHGCEGAGITSNSATSRIVSNMEYVAVTRNSDQEEDTAVTCVYTGLETNTWSNVTIVGNYSEEGSTPDDKAFSVSSPLDLQNCIIGGDGGEGYVEARNLIEVQNGELLSVDGTCIDTSHGPTSLNVAYQRDNAQTEDGVVGTDPVPYGAGLTGLSPDFISLDPSDPNYLRVTNVAFEFLGPSEVPLVGAGYFYPLSFTGIRDENGDFQTFIEGITIPFSTSSDKYSQPGDDELLIFSAAAHNILEGELQAASNIASLVNYDVVNYEDTISDNYYATLMESSEGAGGWRGFFWFDLSPNRKVVMESPHPRFDGTRLEGIDLGLKTNALAFMQSGTHRNNSPLLSPCDGTQSSGDPYFLSDMAHNAESFYQMAHKMINNFHEDTVSVSVHGMGDSSDPADVVISNGTGTQINGTSLSRDVADHMNTLLIADPRFAVSHQEPGENPALSGSTNTQGRYTNGSADPCEEPGFILSPERFIHMEQDPDVRNTPASNWDFVTQTYNDLIPEFPAQTIVAKEDGSLVSEFLLNGDAVSTTGQRPGTLQGAAVIGENRFSVLGNALQFTDSAYAEIGDYPYEGSDTEFTLSYWFRVNKVGTDSFQYMLSHGSVGRDGEVTIPDSLHVYLERDTGELRVRFILDDGTPWLYSGPTNLNDDGWHFFTLTYSQTEGGTVYVDGNNEGSLSDLALRNFDPEGTIILGGRSDLSAERFMTKNLGETGLIDSFRIHNTALDQAGITALFTESEVMANFGSWDIF